MKKATNREEEREGMEAAPCFRVRRTGVRGRRRGSAGSVGVSPGVAHGPCATEALARWVSAARSRNQSGVWLPLFRGRSSMSRSAATFAPPIEPRRDF